MDDAEDMVLEHCPRRRDYFQASTTDNPNETKQVQVYCFSGLVLLRNQVIDARRLSRR